MLVLVGVYVGYLIPHHINIHFIHFEIEHVCQNMSVKHIPTLPKTNIAYFQFLLGPSLFSRDSLVSGRVRPSTWAKKKPWAPLTSSGAPSGEAQVGSGI